MKRRGVLGAIVAMSGTGCIEDIENTVRSATEPQGSEKKFGATSPGFHRAAWTDDGDLEVEFEDDHGMDGWGIRYHAHSDFNDDIIHRSAPDFGETVAVDLLGAFRDYNGRPPTGEYLLVAYEGKYGGFLNVVEEELGDVSYQIEPKLAIDDVSVDSDYALTAMVTNSGNAPCRIDAITIRGKTTPVDATVAHGETQEIVSGPKIFPVSEENERCMELLEEFTVQFSTVPKQDLEAQGSQSYESERVCTVSTL